MNLKTFLSVIIVASIVLEGCDKISDPIFPKQSNSSLPSTPPTYIDSSTSYKIYKILLEDCTAHKCPNCPPAELEAENLLSSGLGPQIVFMEDNMGSLAGTTPVTGYPSYAFSKYYVCEADSAWNILFGIAAIGLPAGMIDRMGYPTNMDYQYSNWQTAIQTQVTANPSPAVTIDIHDSCWVPQRILGAEFQVHFNQALTGNYLLVTGIVEDSIVDWQLDNALIYGADSVFDHHNVLRGTFDLTGTGIAIPASDNAVGSTFTSYQTYDFTKGENGKAVSWKMSNCYIMAFVYGSPGNTTTPYQVVQAEMIKME
jgi:hypothetical protein